MYDMNVIGVTRNTQRHEYVEIYISTNAFIRYDGRHKQVQIRISYMNKKVNNINIHNS